MKQSLPTHNNASDVSALKATDRDIKWTLQCWVDSLWYQTVQVDGTTQQLCTHSHANLIDSTNYNKIPAVPNATGSLYQHWCIHMS